MGVDYNDNYIEGNYNCDKCNKKGDFYDGTMNGVGEGNLEFGLCLECLEIHYVCIDEKTNDIIVDYK